MRIIGNDPSIPRQAQIVASGTLSTGDTVVVNSDGTVSAVADTSVSQDLGSPTVFETSQSFDFAATFDENAGKVVVVYRDDSNSNYTTAIVGTVSGTSISFGTSVVAISESGTHYAATYDVNAQKVVIACQSDNRGKAIVGTVSGTTISFGSAATFDTDQVDFTSATYDVNAQKVVIAYQDGGNSDHGTAVVGTVSGTSISFGTPVVFESATVEEVSAVYHTSAQKIVIAYRDDGNSLRGTAIVGTVSGTSISFGSASVFETGATTQVSVAYDANAQKIVIAYCDFSNSSFGTAIVATVSGTSISFGTPVVFESASISGGPTTTSYDSNAEKVVIAYTDSGNADRGKLVVGTVSGTSISFGAVVQFESGQTDNTSSTFDSTNNKIVIAYRDAGNSNRGTSVVFQNAKTEFNLTAENYIGTAATGAADTQRAKINLKGAVDENQSGLTAGQSYYVQIDGTLGTTPDSPSVFAGTAVAANKLIVKG